MITIDDVIKERKRLRFARKRKIFVDDGASVSYYHSDYPMPPTAEEWLGWKFGVMEGAIGNQWAPNPTKSDINCYLLEGIQTGDGLIYSDLPWYNFRGWEAGAGAASGRPNITGLLYESTGKDAAQILGEFLDDRDSEFFIGFRVNDRHDTSKGYEELLPAKQLLWDEGALLVNGVVNGADFSHPLAYSMTRDLVLDVINRADTYKMDGICLLFVRHLGNFKNFVTGEYETTQEQIDIMTQWFREINDALNQKSIELMQQGKPPLLMMVKVPDDPDYALKCSLDINKWMQEDFIDILVPISYRQTNLLRDSVAWGRSRGVAVCPSFQDPRSPPEVRNHTRLTPEGILGRAMQVLGASPDGIEVYNYNYGFDLNGGFTPPSGEFWRLLDYDKAIESRPRDYFQTWTTRHTDEIGTGAYLPLTNYYDPNYMSVSANKPFLGTNGEFVIEIYEDKDRLESVHIRLLTDSPPSSIIFNGVKLSTFSKSGVDQVAIAPVSSLIHGINVIEIKGLTTRLTDIRIRVR